MTVPILLPMGMSLSAPKATKNRCNNQLGHVLVSPWLCVFFFTPAKPNAWNPNYKSSKTSCWDSLKNLHPRRSFICFYFKFFLIIFFKPFFVCWSFRVFFLLIHVIVLCYLFFLFALLYFYCVKHSRLLSVVCHTNIHFLSCITEEKYQRVTFHCHIKI